MLTQTTTFHVQAKTLLGWYDVDGFSFTKHTEAHDSFELIRQHGVAKFYPRAEAVRLIRRDETVIDTIEESR